MGCHIMKGVTEQCMVRLRLTISEELNFIKLKFMDIDQVIILFYQFKVKLVSFGTLWFGSWHTLAWILAHIGQNSSGRFFK